MRQRELGMRLRQLRNERGLTQEQVAKPMEWSAPKISRFETAARPARVRDVHDLCAVYGVLEREQKLAELSREARERGWWNEYEDLDLDPYIDLEQDTTATICFSMYYVPALLQTEDYARAIIKTISTRMAPDVHQQHVEARMRRQQLLDDDHAFRYHVLLDEAVLHRRVGGPAVMAAELDKVLKAQRRTKVTIKVTPYGHSVLLEFESRGRQPVAFVEGLNSNRYLERQADVARYREDIEHLRGLALSPHDSMENITEVWRTCVSGTRSRVRSFSEEVRARVTGSYKRRRAALAREEAERREREEAERREREEAERRKDRRRTAVKALILGGEIIVTLIREHLFKGTGPGRLF